MKMRTLGLVIATIVASVSTAMVIASDAAGDDQNASPIFGVTIPKGYREWTLIAPALEDAPFTELRAVLGNSTAVEAYQAGTLPFPDGTVLVKLAWKRVRSPEFEPVSVLGAATTVQVMVKDAKKYATTGG